MSDHVFGEFENGGTSTFYISPVPFEQLGFPTTDRTVSPAEFNRMATRRARRSLLRSVALGMTGIYLALEHRSKARCGPEPKHAAAADDSPGME